MLDIFLLQFIVLAFQIKTKTKKANLKSETHLTLRLADEGLRTCLSPSIKCNFKNSRIVLFCDMVLTFSAVNKATFDSRSSVLTGHNDQSRLYLKNLISGLEMEAQACPYHFQI